MTRDMFSAIVAMDEKQGIGKDGGMPWHLPGDLRYFQRLTRGEGDPVRRNAVIMGRKTWLSIPEAFRPLNGRLNIVLTRNPSFVVPEGVCTAASLTEGLRLAVEGTSGDIFVIGGQEVFAEALRHPGCTRLYVTKIQKAFDCDVFFPEFESEFEVCETSAVYREGDCAYCFMRYEKKVRTQA